MGTSIPLIDRRGARGLTAQETIDALDSTSAQDLDGVCLSIGRMAQLNGVSVKTLHVYQEKGLLEPHCVDSKTGYRYYTFDQCSTLDAIYQLKSLGFTLEEIRTTLAWSAAHDGASSLRERVLDYLDSLEFRRRELDFSESLARGIVATCDLLENEPLCDQIMLERLPQRKAIAFDIPEVTPTDVNNAQWELAVRSVKMQLAQSGFPPALFQNVSGVIEEEELRKRTIVTRKALIFIDDNLARYFDDALIEIPAGQYLVMYKRQSLVPDGVGPEYQGILDMLDYAESRGFAIAGSYIGETLAATPLFAYQGRDSFFRMCLPIR